MTLQQKATLSPRKLEQLRMLADWQLVRLGYDPTEITNLCRDADEHAERLKMPKDYS